MQFSHSFSAIVVFALAWGAIAAVAIALGVDIALDALAPALPDDAARDAFSYAMAGSFWIMVGLVAVGAALTWAFVRDPEPAGEPAPSPEPGELRHHMHHRRFHL